MTTRQRSRRGSLFQPSTRRLLKCWHGSRVEAKGRMARSEGGASPKWAVTTERRRQLPFCFGPLTVALILAAACVARLAEIAADIGTAFRALANAKIHSNATHSSISTVSEGKYNSNVFGIFAEVRLAR